MTEGVLTAEELALLPERAREGFRAATWAGPHAIRDDGPSAMIVYLCYELVQAKTEIKWLHLKLEAIHDESQS